MVKGVTRQVILVDAPGRERFEKAIFILRDGGEGVSEASLLREARALASEAMRGPRKRISDRIPRWLWALAGAGLVGAAWLAVGILR